MTTSHFGPKTRSEQTPEERRETKHRNWLAHRFQRQDPPEYATVEEVHPRQETIERARKLGIDPPQPYWVVKLNYLQEESRMVPGTIMDWWLVKSKRGRPRYVSDPYAAYHGYRPAYSAVSTDLAPNMEFVSFKTRQQAVNAAWEAYYADEYWQENKEMHEHGF